MYHKFQREVECVARESHDEEWQLHKINQWPVAFPSHFCRMRQTGNQQEPLAEETEKAKNVNRCKYLFIPAIFSQLTQYLKKRKAKTILHNRNNIQN